MVIENLIWILPRPRKNKYKGGFPLHFETKLIKELLGKHPKNIEKNRIIHLFGGMAEWGVRIDINPEVKPDILGDAHNLYMIEHNKYDLVICDPPYTNELSKELYNTGKIKYKDYINEAVRICKNGGYIASYHIVMTPRPERTKYHMRIFIGTRIWHKTRICCIFKKDNFNEIIS